MTDFDRIIASAPLNSTASKVMGKGEHYEPQLNLSAGRLHWDTCPPLKPRAWYAALNGVSKPTVDALLGHRTGRLTAIGVYASTNPKKNAQWVVRCDCGRFETRKARSLTNPENADDCCAECFHVRLAKKRYERLGPREIGEFR